MAQTRYVNTASSAGGDGTTNATAGANRAFVSLNDALTSIAAVLSEPWTIYCEGTAADTESCPAGVWNQGTDPVNFLEIRGNNTSGKWDTSKYRIEVTDEHGLYNNYASHVRIYDLQVQVTITLTVGATPTCYRLATANNFSANIDHRYYRCIARGVYAGGSDNVFGFNDSDPVTYTGTARRINCIAYGLRYGFGSDGGAWAAADCRNYNCTAYGNTYNYIDDQICVNCLSAAPTTNGFESTGTSGHSNNAASDTSAGGSNARDSQTFSFVDAGGGDFHLQAGDGGAKDFGLSDPASGLYSDDIDGVARTGSWDIGADEYVSSAPPPSYQSVNELLRPFNMVRKGR